MRQKRSRIVQLPAAALVLSVLLIPRASADDVVVEFDPQHWDLTRARVVDHLGRKAVAGTALLRDVEFTNGVIEVDIAVNGDRSYPGLVFRQQDPTNLERFYVRPHRANGAFEDALQYTPTINGIAGWQLYSGDGFTAPIKLPFDEWVHVRLDVHGSQARVFIGDADEPALEIKRLKHGAGGGAIGVMGPQNGTAYFSNFKWRRHDGLQFEPVAEPSTPYGTITEWELSRAYEASEIDIELAPDAQGLTDLGWHKVATEPSGLLDVARHVRRTPGEPDWIWARTYLDAKLAETRTLQFGYSDWVAVFLNGELLFVGDSAYRSRDPSFAGIVGLHDTLYLSLQPGENELLLLVGESFGGWGLMARDASATFEREGMVKAWELERTFKYPESVQYDRKRDVLYVSNFFNSGDEFISRVGTDGTVLDLKWVSGLNRPTGLYLDDERLYVVTRAELVEIDADLGEIVARHAFPDPGFQNDVTGDSASGDVFVSDSRGNRILRFRGGAFETWLEGDEVVQPNGLFLDGDSLMFGSSGTGCLMKADVEDRTITTVACLGEGSIVDGVRPDGRGNYVVSDFNGRVFLVTPTGDKTRLLDSSAPGMFCADLEFVGERDLLVIPTLNDNRLVAYRLETR